MLPIGLFQFIDCFNAGFPKFDTKLDCTSLLELALFHFHDTHTKTSSQKTVLKLVGDASELKLILEVYDTFTYPSCERRACSVASSCDMRAVSLLYLQTTCTHLTVGMIVAQCRASNIEKSMIVLLDTRRLAVSRMEEL